MVKVVFVANDNTLHTYEAKSLEDAKANAEVLKYFGHKVLIVTPEIEHLIC